MRIAQYFISALLSLVILGGCATRPKIDWNTRVGHYDYNQAIVDLGVPDKYAKLSDGTVVAEWIVHRYSPDYVTFGFGGGFWGGPFFGGPEAAWAYPMGSYYDKWLRLVFAPDGKLRDWKKYDR